MLIKWESRFLSFKEQGREWILFSCFRLHFSVDGFVFAAKNVLVDTEWGEIIVLLFHWKIRIHHVFSFPLLKTLQILDKTFCSYLLEKHFLKIIHCSVSRWLWHFASHYFDTYKWTCHEVCMEMNCSLDTTLVVTTWSYFYVIMCSSK